MVSRPAPVGRSSLPRGRAKVTARTPGVRSSLFQRPWLSLDWASIQPPSSRARRGERVVEGLLITEKYM